MQFLVLAFILIALVFRFLFLESSPPGFFVNEAHGGLTLLCFAETGQDPYGRSISLFAESLNGGNWGPLFLYTGYIWVKFFGGTIESLRIYQAFISLITIYLIYLICRELDSKSAGIWAVICALISPWSIQLGRMHWEAGLLPLCLLAAIYFGLIGSNSKLKMALSGFFFACAAYAYPSGRVDFPLIFCLFCIFLYINKKIQFKEWLLMFFVILLVLVPFVYFIYTGDLMGRGSIVGIYTKHYLNRIGKPQNIFSILEVFKDNFLLHLSPNFLVFNGDKILRHHSGFGGQLGILEVIGFILLPVIAIRNFYNNISFSFTKSWKCGVIFIFCCFLICFVPAAFTWDSIPHALRSIPGWTFSSILAGVAINKFVKNNKYLIALITVCGISYFALYTRDYLYEYPKRAAIWFDIQENQEAKARVEENDWQSVIKKYKQEPNENYLTHMRYWMIAYGGYSCEESRELFGF